MREIELKIRLTPSEARRLASVKAVTVPSKGRTETFELLNTYFDTEDSALQNAGIALRLRRKGGLWLQTIKKADGPISGGLSSPLEEEIELEEGVLSLGRIADHDLREQVIGLSRAGLSPVAETRFRRTQRTLVAPSGSRIELAVDMGQLKSGECSAPFAEAELELAEGDPGDLYLLAGRLFPKGPVRFSEAPKSARARGLGPDGEPEPLLRKHRPVVLSGQESVTEAAVLILREGFAHAVPNIARLVDMDDPDGPHQLRVGLRRLRSALSVFRSGIGRGLVQPWADRAREMASEAGRLRDLDVLGSDLVAPLAGQAPGEAGFQVLLDAIADRRVSVQKSVRAALSGPEATAFCFGFPRFLLRLEASWDATKATSIHAYASKALTKRWKAVAAYGDRIEDLTIDERHEMRKELKKLRYVIDAFRSLYDPDEVSAFQKPIKRLQTAFGALNDSAMAETLLSAEDAPGRDDPAAQHAAGRVVGYLAARSDQLWPEAVTGWANLRERRLFWK